MKRTAKTKEIRKALIDTERTQASIAAEINVTRMFVGRVIQGKASSERAYEAIAAACNKPVDELFPPTVTQ
jgi:transcriptional regulator with XRE-family HTH domain